MWGNGRLATALAIAVAALGVAGCGGDDDETTTSSTTATTATGATGASGATGGEGSAAGTITLEDAEQAFQDEGIDTNEVEPGGILRPDAESAFSLISKDTGTVAHGGVYVYESSEDAEKAMKNAEGTSDLDYQVVGNLLLSQDPEPYEGFPTIDEMAEILNAE